MIEVQGLTKVFEDRKRGKIVAVDHIDFSVGEGEIFGLLGTNGAGKTTTLRILATILTPTEGTVLVAGYDVVARSGDVRRSIGFLSGDTKLYIRVTPRELLDHYGRLYGMTKAGVGERIEELIDLFEMGEFIDTKIGKLSTGQKQRTSICRAIVHRPKLMIFDEPTAGLDPVSARHITDFIRRNRDEGNTILFSTHYLREAERLCDRIGILHRGTVRAMGTLPELTEKTGTADIEEAFFQLIDVEEPPSREKIA